VRSAHGAFTSATTLPHKQVALAFIDSLKGALFISNTSADLVFADSARITLANKYVVAYTWSQILNGFPVLGGRVSVVMNDSGQIYETCSATTNPALPTDYTVPQLSAGQAINFALANWGLPTSALATADMFYLPTNDTNYLVWEVALDSTYLNAVGARIDSNIAYVSQNGNIVNLASSYDDINGYGIYYPRYPTQHPSNQVQWTEPGWVDSFFTGVEYAGPNAFSQTVECVRNFV